MSDKTESDNPSPDEAEAPKEDVTSSQDEASSEAPPKKTFWKRLPATTLVIIIGSFFVWHLFADRITPYTNNARVKTYVIPITPMVSGYISETSIQQNEKVIAGQVLFQIDKKPFELQVRQMEAALKIASQNVDVKSASIESAIAKLAEAANEYENVKAVTSRILSLKDTEAVSQMQVDQAKAQLSKAQASREAAQANLKREKEALGPAGNDNPEIQNALARLEQAQFDLFNTTVRAPTNGYVTNSNITKGYYATQGSPALTFISTDQVWIEADMSENNLGNVKTDQDVEILFDMYPGRIFNGKVIGYGWGASDGQANARGDLPTVADSSGWLRKPQNFPVLIKLTDYEYNAERSDLRLNSQANVMIFTKETSVLNPLGKLWMRIGSLLNYLY